MRPKPAVLLLACLTVLLAAAQTSGYAGQQSRPVKALSGEETADLLAGRDMGLAKAGVLNHFPGLAHVVALADRLKLTPVQREAVQASLDRMKAAAKPLGAELIGRERALEDAFRDHGPTPAELDGLTSSVAAVQGKLRAGHLYAHVEMKGVLFPEPSGLANTDRTEKRGPNAMEPAFA